MQVTFKKDMAKQGRKNLDAITKLLLEKKQTVAVAESVTSGSLQTAFSLGDRASEYFMGGVTAYNVVQKVELLNVHPSDAVACNCVSENISQQMCRSVNELFSSYWAIAVTGYASPLPPFTDNGLYACFAISRNRRVVKKGTIKCKEMDAEDVIKYYTEKILGAFLKELRGR